MKIEYDPSLYKKIASLSLNDIVLVTNRKGINSSVHIENIIKLSWRDLQLLMPDGEDRFTKMVLLFNKYIFQDNSGEGQSQKERLTPSEKEEISEYIKIYRYNSFSKHFEVNRFISDNDLWEKFPTIRSLNDHGEHKEIPGIQPKYFIVVCQLLGISGEGGLSLDAYKKY